MTMKYHGIYVHSKSLWYYELPWTWQKLNTFVYIIFMMSYLDFSLEPVVECLTHAYKTTIR